MRRFLLKGALALGVVTLACSSGDITAPGTETVGNANVPASVVITSPASSDILIGSVVNLVAAVRNASGQDISNIAITWSSSDATVASVSSAGALTALKVGTTLVTGSASGRSASITINVKAVPVSQVAVTIKTNLIVGESATAVATPTDASGNVLSGRAASWTSLNPGVAIVSPTGVVTAISVGSASIEAVVDGVIGSANVVVAHAPTLIGSINVTLADGILRSVSATTVATASVLDLSGNTLTNRVITWTSSNLQVATISQLGIVTATGLGTAVITASSEGKSGSASVVVVFPVGQPIGTVSLSTSSLTLNPGRSSQLSATVRDINGNIITDRPTVWQSSNPAAFTVTQTGLVTAVALGFGLVSATTEGRTSSVTVQVVAAPLASLSLAGTSVLQPAQTSQLTTLVRDVDNNIVSGVEVLWSSSAPAVATVGAITGLVTAVGRGTATITATSGIVSSTITITVPPVAIINVTAPAVRLQPTQTTQAAFALFDASNNAATNRAVVWASSAPAVATVSTAGLVTAIRAGTTNITVTSEGVTGTLVITVPPVAVINVTAPSVRLQPTQTTLATGAILDALNAPVANRPSVWASSAPAIATVSATGLVTAIAPGTTNITLTSEGITGTLVITVPPVATINVTATAVILQPTGTAQATGVLLDALNAPVLNRTSVWASSAPAVATVSPTGFITAVAVGTANITLTSEGITGTLVITVPPVATVTVSVGTNFLLVGQTTNATATLRDASNNLATNRAVTWSSGTPAVATISPLGVITVVSVGTTVITATSEGRTGTLTFTVVPPVGSIVVTSSVTQLLVGQTTQLNATILDTFGAPYVGTRTWSSSDPARATVSQTGLVTATTSGSLANVTFSVSAGGVTQGRAIAIVGHPTETLAELPRVFLNTAAPAAPDVGGRVFSVPSNANPVTAGQAFQTALNSAVPGDVIELENGGVFTGNFRLKNKPNTGKWVTIRPQVMTNMPAEGVRMTPTIAALVNLPRLISPNNQGAIESDAGAHHYRIIGIEVTVPATVLSTGLVRFDANQTTAANTPHNLVLDRSYVHGTATGSVTRCVALNSATSAVIDSWLSDCHSTGDAQAIGGWAGPGPYKIVNNYLEASGENIMFGGGDPGITNLIPADIEIRRNHFFKPTAWKGNPLFVVKNLFELKAAQRVLVEANIFENNWADGQGGNAINIKSTNQGGTCGGCGTTDVTFRLNLIRNVGSGFVISGAPDVFPTTLHAARITVTDNVMMGVSTGIFNGDGRGLLLNGDVADLVFANNTVMDPSSGAVVFGGGGAAIRATIRDNIIGGGASGVKGSGIAGGTASINTFMPGGVFAANAITLSSAAGYPGNNDYPTSAAAVGFTSLTGLDFRLGTTSTLRNRSTEGRDIGANVAAINAAVAGVIVP